MLTGPQIFSLSRNNRHSLLAVGPYCSSWSNMGNRGFLHTTPAMPTILLSSIKLSLPADPVDVPPLRPGKFHIRSLSVFCSQIWTISSSWLAVGSRISEHQNWAQPSTYRVSAQEKVNRCGEDPIFKINAWYSQDYREWRSHYRSLQLIISSSNQKLHE